MQVDPVCGNPVDDEAQRRPVGKVRGGAPEVDPRTGTRRYHGGSWYYFCSMACRQQFLGAPASYVH